VLLSFEDLTALEPALADVLQLARDRVQSAGARFCAVKAFAELRALLRKLVGPGREGRHPILSQSRALLVAEEQLAEELPKCRGHQGHRLVRGELVPFVSSWPHDS
jgi:hypothetical protein